jgi:RNA polymerase sigma-19 factor, ECF subfamily
LEPLPKNRQPGAEAVVTAFREYDQELHSFLMHRLRGRREVSEDIRQEIYLRLLRFSRADLVHNPRAYLFRVARNVLYDRRLLHEKEFAVFEPSNSTTAEAVIEDQAGHADLERDLEHILSKLPRLYAAVLRLRKQHGLSYSEIAHELDVSEHTVKKYIRLALVEARLISLEVGFTASRRKHG